MPNNSEKLGHRLYRQIDVWVRVGGDSVACYRCFEILPDRKFCVQSKDLFYNPPNQESIQHSSFQFINLLAEIAPEKRSKMHDTLEAAIEAHERYFSWHWQCHLVWRQEKSARPKAKVLSEAINDNDVWDIAEPENADLEQGEEPKDEQAQNGNSQRPPPRG